MVITGQGKNLQYLLIAIQIRGLCGMIMHLNLNSGSLCKSNIAEGMNFCIEQVW